MTAKVMALRPRRLGRLRVMANRAVCDLFDAEEAAIDAVIDEDSGIGLFSPEVDAVSRPIVERQRAIRAWGERRWGVGWFDPLWFLDYHEDGALRRTDGGTA